MDFEEAYRKLDTNGDLHSRVYAKFAAGDRQGAADYLKSVIGCDDEIAMQVVEKSMRNAIIPTPEQVAYVNAYEASRKNAVQCPYCHSTETSKITKSSKVFNTAMFGLFGTKRLKEWHCNSCGSDF